MSELATTTPGSFGSGRFPRVAAVAGLGAALPPEIVTNAALGLEVDDAWIQQRTGIAERRRLAPDVPLAELAATAGRAALADAAVPHEAIDLVLVATTSADHRLPGEAPRVADALGLRPVAAMDIGAGCVGFITALELAAASVESRRASNVLVVAAERMSRFGHRDPMRTGAIFGDGAGAVVVGSGHGATIGPFVHGVEIDDAVTFAIRDRGATETFEMDGEAVFERAVDALVTTVHSTLTATDTAMDDIDLLVLHQGNARITRAVSRRLGLRDDPRVVDAIARTANTAAASIPLALEAARADGRLRPGTRVLLAAVGAGMQRAGTLLEWGAR